MGCRFEARCLDCGRRFMVDSGGGFRFHLLHCDTCGKTKSVRFEELGLIHLRYLKGLPGPYCVASSEHDRYVQEHLDLEPLPEDDYQREVEAVAGNCRCGGRFSFDAPARCPRCRSTRFERGGTLVYELYD